MQRVIQDEAHRFALWRGLGVLLTQDHNNDSVYGRVRTSLPLHSCKGNEPQQRNKPLGKEEDFTDENQLITTLHLGSLSSHLP